MYKISNILGLICVGFLVMGCEKSTIETSQMSVEPVQVDTVEVDSSVKKVIKKVNPDITCDKTQKPVCGKISDRQKNAFLNQCEAERHYAEILNTGFCGRKNTVKNNCSGVVMGIGNCERVISGWEFYQGSCHKVVVSGCDAEIPFITKEACENRCR